MLIQHIREVFTGKPFEFYSSYSLQEAHQRLVPNQSENVHQQGFIRIEQDSLSVQIHETTKQSLRFTAHQNLVTWVEANAHVKPSGLLVTGHIKIRLFMSLIIVFMFAITILVLLVSQASSVNPENHIMLILSVVMVFFVISLFVQCIYQQRNLYQTIQHRLGKTKRKKIYA